MSLFDRWHKIGNRLLIINILSSFFLIILFGAKIETSFLILNQWWSNLGFLIPDYNLIEFIFPYKSKFFKENEVLLHVSKNLKKVQILFISIAISLVVLVFMYAFKIEFVYDFFHNLGEIWIELIYYLSPMCFFVFFNFSPQYVWSKTIAIRTLDLQSRKSFAHTSAYYQIYAGFILRNTICNILSLFGVEGLDEIYLNLILGIILSFIFYVISVELPYWYGSSQAKKDKLNQLNKVKSDFLIKREQEKEFMVKIYYTLEANRLEQEILETKKENVHLHKGVLMIPVALAGVIANFLLTEILQKFIF